MLQSENTVGVSEKHESKPGEKVVQEKCQEEQTASRASLTRSRDPVSGLWLATCGPGVYGVITAPMLRPCLDMREMVPAMIARTGPASTCSSIQAPTIRRTANETAKRPDMEAIMQGGILRAGTGCRGFFAMPALVVISRRVHCRLPATCQSLFMRRT